MTNNMSLTQIAVYGQIQHGLISKFNYGVDDEILKLVYAYVGKLLLQCENQQVIFVLSQYSYDLVRLRADNAISSIIYKHGTIVDFESFRYHSRCNTNSISFCGVYESIDKNSYYKNPLFICLDYHNLSDDEKNSVNKFKRKILLSEGE